MNINSTFRITLIDFLKDIHDKALSFKLLPI